MIINPKPLVQEGDTLKIGDQLILVKSVQYKMATYERDLSGKGSSINFMYFSRGKKNDK
jgi:hypothetical protein